MLVCGSRADEGWQKRPEQALQSLPKKSPRYPSEPPPHRQNNPSSFPFPKTQNIPYPQSQSFSRSYGPNLPTSLTYIILSTRGCSPWRPDAVMSTTGAANTAELPREKVRHTSVGFSRTVTSAPDTTQMVVLSRLDVPSLRVNRFQGA